MTYIPTRNFTGLDMDRERYYHKSLLKSEFEKGYIQALDDLLGLNALGEHDEYSLFNYLEKAFDGYIYSECDDDEGERSTIDKIKAELAEEIYDHVFDYINMRANEINCSFIENQEDDENEDGDSPSVDIETIRAKMETKEIR